MHFAQAFTLSPLTKPALFSGRRTHCKLAYRLLFAVGLNFPRSFITRQDRPDVFSQIAHFAIILSVIKIIPRGIILSVSEKSQEPAPRFAEREPIYIIYTIFFPEILQVSI